MRRAFGSGLSDLQPTKMITPLLWDRQNRVVLDVSISPLACPFAFGHPPLACPAWLPFSMTLLCLEIIWGLLGPGTYFCRHARAATC